MKRLMIVVAMMACTCGNAWAFKAGMNAFGNRVKGLVVGTPRFVGNVLLGVTGQRLIDETPEQYQNRLASAADSYDSYYNNANNASNPPLRIQIEEMR